MPWPPTGGLSPFMTLEEQLSSPGVPGTDTELLGQVAQDPLTGIIAPGGLDPTTFSFDALPSPDEELLQPTDAGTKRQMVIDWAKQWVDKADYVWGGESIKEGGFDCSGLLYAAFKHAGMSIPRVSMAQARRGVRVKLSALQPGDFVAWDGDGRAGADHIALYIGNGQILEAAHSGTKVRIRKLGNNEGAWGVHLNY